MLDSNLLLDNVTVAHDMRLLSEPTNDTSPVTRKFLQEYFSTKLVGWKYGKILCANDWKNDNLP